MCDQLFVNDTDCDSQALNDVLRLLPWSLQSVVVTQDEIRDNFGVYDQDSDRTMVYPGTGSRIAQEILQLSSWIYLPSVKRKILPWSMTPRGIEISSDDVSKVGQLLWPVTIVDDVIASGTTINGLYKRLPIPAKSDCRVMTLVLRYPNDLRSVISVDYGVVVQSKSGWYPKINTLSTLHTSSRKRDLVLSGRNDMYGIQFVDEIKKLFSI